MSASTIDSMLSTIEGNPSFPISNWVQLQLLKAKRIQLTRRLEDQENENRDAVRKLKELRKAVLRLGVALKVKDEKTDGLKRKIGEIRGHDYIRERKVTSEADKKIEKLMGALKRLEEVSSRVLEEWESSNERMSSGMY
jgi:chromosome segregation ATPase